MITFKQLESFITLADAGTFEQAARNLGTAQSAVSRHIAEFESHFSNELLDRSGRRAMLTLDGADVLMRCRAILRDRDAMLQMLKREALPIQCLRLGVTEISALTWLPHLLDSLQTEFPEVKASASVQSSAQLLQQLESGDLDMIIVPDHGHLGLFNTVRMGRMTINWYCGRGIRLGPAGLSLRQLSDMPLLSLGPRTHSGALLSEWLQSHSVSPKLVISCTSTTKLLDLLAAGVGVACLPSAVVQELMDEQKIILMDIEPKVPPLNYVMLTPRGIVPSWKRNVMALTKKTCDFNQRYRAVLEPTPTSELKRA